MIAPYKAVFFDAGGTLFRPYPSVGAIYAEVAARYGCTATAQTLEELFHAAWLKRDGLASLAGHSDEKIERQWWRALVYEIFSQVRMPDDFDAFFNELYELFGSPVSWRVFPETEEVLRALRAAGKRLGIISNWDSRLFHLCEGLGLNHYFDFVLASAVFGAAKPGRRIFQEALCRVGLQPWEAVHIGDSFEDDVQGALNVGMEAILIDRNIAGRPRDRSHFPARLTIVQDLREIL